MSHRTVITAEQIPASASSGTFEVPEGALVTPLAHDIARDRGISLVTAGLAAAASAPQRAATVGEDDEMAERVRAIVMTVLAGAGAGNSAGSRPRPGGVKLCKQQDATLEDFPYPGPPAGMQVRTGDVVTAEDSSPIAAGYMTLTAGEFPWTFTYDEVQIVLEGELHLGTADGVRIGRPGDILYVPKGSEITFGTPQWAKFIYVTFPADWEAGL